MTRPTAAAEVQHALALERPVGGQRVENHLLDALADLDVSGGHIGDVA
jgi:hypothetical protein